MTELVGIAWDHPRGVAGLRAVAERLAAETGISVRWEVHSLAEFSAASIGAVAANYDLVIYDHPFVGDVAAEGAMIDLAPHLEPAHLADLRGACVGRGLDLFTWEDALWGLPVDAAVQVAAFRPDLCARAGFDARSLAAAPLAEVIRRLETEGMRLAISFTNVGSVMCFFSFCAQLGAPAFARAGEMVPRAAGRKALETMRLVLDAAPPEVLDWESIGCLEAMARRDDLAYCPCVFGFSAYSMAAWGGADGRRPLAFTAGPVPPGGHRAAGIIGGAGVGVSTACAEPAEAARYAARLMDADIQIAMGHALAQPGHRAAWTDPGLNAASLDFYGNTLAIMDAGYIRPRWHGWVPRQDAAGHALERHLRAGSPPDTILDELEAIFLAG